MSYQPRNSDVTETFVVEGTPVSVSGEQAADTATSLDGAGLASGSPE
jgi:hypothetical protein